MLAALGAVLGAVLAAHGRASLRPPAMLYQLMDFEEGEGGGSPDVSVSLVSLSMGMGWAGTFICFRGNQGSHSC